MEEQQVTFVSLREAYVDRLARRGRFSPNSRVDLMRDICGKVYDAGMLVNGIAERWVDDEPLFDMGIICPDCRAIFPLVAQTHTQILNAIADLRLRGHGGDTETWRTHIMPQIAQDCGLN